MESGDAGTALSWLERIPVAESFMADERDRLLLQVHEILGNDGDQAIVAWRVFRQNRSSNSLERLLAVIGNDKREAVIAQETQLIQQQAEWSLTDMEFLIGIDMLDEAVSYLLARAGQLNGDYYEGLLSLARTLESEGRPLAASVIYRALLDSILRRGQSRIYHHGIHHLKVLDRLAHTIDDWRNMETHEFYKQRLREKHGRKVSFWSHYDE